MRMGQRRNRARFALEAVTRRRIGADIGRQHFQRDRAIEAGVACLVDLPHPAGAEWRGDLVGPKRFPGGR